MIDLSLYTEPLTQVKRLYTYIGDQTLSADTFSCRCGRDLLMFIVNGTQIAMQAHSDLNCKEWRIMHDANGIEFYIYVDVNTVKIYSVCPKQLTMDLLRVV